MTKILFFSKIRRHLSRYQREIRFVILSALIYFLILFLYSFLPPIIKFAQTFLQGPGSLISFTRDPLETLHSTNNRTNLLLMGMGGAGHEGALLTDSMLVLSYNHNTKVIHLISLPRDLWVDSLKTKINAAYYYGEQKQPGGGLILAKSAATELTGLPIHYGFTIDFAGFEKAIDLIGGVNINIERSFDDYQYPIPGLENTYPESLRYEHLRFEAGLEHMNGERALKFVRTRHAEGDEGTDFARSHRQQLVLLAFKDQLVSTQTLLSPQRLSELIDLYSQYTNTDIVGTEYTAFARLVLLLKRDQIKSITLSTGDEKTNELGILENPKNRNPYQGQYILIARDGNWNALKQYIQNELNN